MKISLKTPKEKRRFLIRIALVLLYFCVTIFVLFNGRGHTILIDNKDADDLSYEAVDGMEVSIDSQESAEYWPGDRDKAVVRGQKHKIRISFFDEEIPEFEATFTVPFSVDMLILSVPKMLAGIEPFIETFVAPDFVDTFEKEESAESFDSFEDMYDGLQQEDYYIGS